MARIYIVRAEETLMQIARTFYGNPEFVAPLAHYNGIVDLDRVFAGQRLEVPTKGELEPPDAAPAPDGAPFAPPHGLEEICRRFGDLFAYLHGDATVDPRWESETLAFAELAVPIPALAYHPHAPVPQFRCHKALVPTFEAVFAALAERGLAGEIRSFGGCYGVRRKRRTAGAYSAHSWGIAIDLNPETNQLGTTGDMHPRVVEVFEAHGFQWGGRWGNARDPMHFQYCSGY